MSSVAARASASGWWRAIHCSLKPGQATEGGLAVSGQRASTSLAAENALTCAVAPLSFQS
jgi:hypothetical protein